MSHPRVPLTESTNGQPITVGTSLTDIHTAPSGQSNVVFLSVMNTTGSDLVATVDVGGVTSTFSASAGGVTHFEAAISDGQVLKMSGDFAGIRVMGWAEYAHRMVC